MRFGRLLLLIGLVVLIAALVYVILTPGALNMLRGSVEYTDQAEIDARVIAFVSNPFTDDYGLLRVPGYVDNLTESELRAVTLQIQLVDEAGTKRESITYVVKDVPPSSRKTFDLNAGTLPTKRTATIEVTTLEVYR